MRKLLFLMLLLSFSDILMGQDKANCLDCREVDKQTNLSVTYKETLRYNPKGLNAQLIYKIQIGIFEVKPQIMPPSCVAIKHNLGDGKVVWYVWYDSYYYEYSDAKFIAETIAKQYACGAFVVNALLTLEK